MEKIAVVIPTYNERENIRTIVERVLRFAPRETMVIVVDDNSPNGTAEIVEEMAASDSRVSVIKRSGKLGLGSAYRTGIAEAVRRGANRIITMDADLSHPTERIPAMLEAARKADLVLGSRYISGGRIENWSARRRLLSRFANLVARLAMRLDVADCTTGFRCYSRELIEAIRLDKIKSEGYSFLEEIVFLSRKHGFKVAEIPITFRDRTRGKSKISRKEILKAILTILRLSLQG